MRRQLPVTEKWMELLLDRETRREQFRPMKLKRLLVLIVLPLLLIFGGTCALIWNLTKLDPPKEVVLIKNFNEHRAAFEQLRDMLLTDTNLSRVADWGIDKRKPFFLGYPSEKDFPMDRFQKYLALLKETDGKVATRGEGEHPDPAVVVWAWGWAGTTRHIGICWLDQAPTNQISTLDAFHGRLDEWAYRHIDSNWYFWTDL